MLDRETLRKIRRIQIRTRVILESGIGGAYHAVFKGRGMEFAEVREYTPGDEVRTIDWNVTARMDAPFVKKFTEEREMTVMLVVDVSASEMFGTTHQTKSRVVAKVAATLAFSAIKNNDRVGAMLFTDRIEKFIPARRGSTHVLRVIREVLYHKPEGRGTRIQKALEHLNLVVRKRAVVFLISDLLDQGFEQSLKVANRRHDVVILQIVDPREQELPDVGIVELRDAETGEIIEVDTSIRRIRENYAANWARDRDRLRRLFQANRIDHVLIDVARPYDMPLVRFFEERARKFR